MLAQSSTEDNACFLGDAPVAQAKLFTHQAYDV
jgi:hypothetical protein